MKKVKSSIFVMVLALGLTVLPGDFAKAAADASDNKMLAIVNMNRIMSTSDVAKDFQSKLEKKRKEYHKQAAAQENELLKAKDDLLKQKSVVTPDVFKEKSQALEERYIKAQKEVFENKKTLDYASVVTLQKIEKEAAQVIADLVEKHNIALVLNKDSVVIANTSLDITDEVIADLNKRIKTISVDWSLPEK